MLKFTSKARRKAAPPAKLRLKKKIVLGQSKTIPTLEARCRALIEHMDLAAWMGDKDERTIYANPKFCELLGYSLKEIIGKESYQFWAPESAEKVRRINMTDRKQGITSSYEGELVTKKGEIIPVLLHGTPLKDGGTVGILRDMRTIKEKEAEVETLIKRFDLAVRGSQDGLWYAEIPITKIRPNTNLDEYIWYSDQFKELMGYGEKEFPNTLRKWKNLIHPDDFKRVARVALKHLKGKNSFDIGCRLRLKNGEYRWFSTRGEVLPTKWKTVLCVAGSFRDITDQKEAENALKQSEDTYRAIFENTGNATIIVEEDTTITYANTQFINMSGYPKDEIINKKKWIDFFAKEDIRRMTEFHVKRRQNPYSAPRNYEARFVDRDGEIRNVFMTVAMIPGTQRSVASILDITIRKVVENELKASKKLFDDLVKGSPTATFVIDTDHKIIYWNRAMEQLTGLKTAEMLGTSDHWKPFYSNSQRMIADMMVDGMRVGGVLKHYEDMDVEESNDKHGIIGSVFFVNFCGQKKWLRFMIKPLRDIQNRVVGAIETVEDITERKRMSEFIENRMREFQVLYQVNAHIRMIHPLKQVLSDIVKDLVLACDEMEPARVRITFDNQIYTNLKKGETFIRKIEEPIKVLEEKRGTIELGYIEKIANEESFTLEQEKKVLHIVAQTLGKHAQSREFMERYQKLIKKSVVGIFIAQDGIFRFANPKFARMFKCNEKEVLGKNYNDLLIDCTCYKKLQKNKKLNSTHCKIQGRRQDGSLMDLEVYTQRIDYYGKPAILGTVQDITKIKQAQERQRHFNEELQLKIAEKTKDLQRANRRLQSLNELKDEFIAVTSHELRSPLTAIKGYLSFLVDEGLFKKIPGDAKDYLTRVYDNVELLNHLVNNILDVSRIETNRFELYRTPTDIVDLINRVIKNLSFHTNEKQLTVHFNNKLTEPVRLNIDAIRIRQVIRNVVENAIKYTPKGKKISIDVEIRGIGIQIAVADQGVGIPKSDIFDIFDKFKQAKNTLAHCKGGAGLGLFIAKKIIELHDGMIWAESAVRKGTTFRIQLPLT